MPNNINVSSTDTPSKEQSEKVAPIEVNVDTKELSDKLQIIIDEIATEKKLREETLKKEEKLKNENDKKLEEENQKNKEDMEIFYKNIQTLVENSETTLEMTYQNQTLEKLDELIFLKKMDFMGIGIFMAIFMVMIYQNSFKK